MWKKAFTTKLSTAMGSGPRIRSPSARVYIRGTKGKVVWRRFIRSIQRIAARVGSRELKTPICRTANVRDMAQASGVRNTWNIAEGISATTSAEYLHVFNGPQQKALALSGGLDYAANPLWRGSTKLEFRRLFDNPALLGNQGQNQWLSTVA